MNRPIRLWAAAAGIILACAIGLWAGSRGLAGRNDLAFGERVRAYILAHPEIVAEAAEKLRIAPVREAAETPFRSAWAGNPRGDVTLVVFSDYNCPYCRASAPQIERLLANDPKVRVVWRELPVLGPGSDQAAAVALAAAKAGKYVAFHRALFAGGHPDQNGLAVAAKVAGLSAAGLIAEGRAPDVQAEIAANLGIARRMGITATPFFIIGNRTHEGALGYDALAAAVADARRDAQ
jgi:predicted DsbA family dithiol-disulfide isomerase